MCLGVHPSASLGEGKESCSLCHPAAGQAPGCTASALCLCISWETEPIHSSVLTFSPHNPHQVLMPSCGQACVCMQVWVMLPSPTGVEGIGRHVDMRQEMGLFISLFHSHLIEMRCYFLIPGSEFCFFMAQQKEHWTRRQDRRSCLGSASHGVRREIKG